MYALELLNQSTIQVPPSKSEARKIGGGKSIRNTLLWPVTTIYCFQIQVVFKFISSSLNQKG